MNTPPSRKPNSRKSRRNVTLTLPDEFLEICQRHGVTPDTVLRGFIADVTGIMSWAAEPRTDGYCSNGSDERSMAYAYYERVGYPWWNR